MDRLYGENKEEGKMGVQLDETEKRIVDLIEANRDEIIAFARDMYTHAELGYKEFKTAEKFTRLMKKLNLPVKEHLAVTGVKAYLIRRPPHPGAQIRKSGNPGSPLLRSSCPDGRCDRGGFRSYRFES